MINKYNELLEMLESKYKVDRFFYLGEETCCISNKNNYIASIYVEDSYLEISIKEVGTEEEVGSRRYKNIEYAYIFIERFLEE